MNISSQLLVLRDVTYPRSTCSEMQTKAPYATFSFRFVQFIIRLNENLHDTFKRRFFRLNACVPDPHVRAVHADRLIFQRLTKRTLSHAVSLVSSRIVPVVSRRQFFFHIWTKNRLSNRWQFKVLPG